MYPSIEDEYGFGIITEPTHSDEDERYYVESILPGWCDEDEADRERDDYDPDFGWIDEYEIRQAESRYERWVYGE